MSCLQALGDDTENVKLHLRLHGNMSHTEVEEVKCAVVCYFQGRVFNPTNLLNHVAHSVELMMQM